MDLTGKTTWHYYDTGFSDAYTNMALDEVLLRKMLIPDAIPILRVYTWSRPSVSVGYFQNVMDDFNLTLCKERGWPLVRRLTGGRAVFHDHELTYSILLPRSYPPLPSGLLGSYRYLSQGLLLGLRELGVEPELVALKDTKRERRGSALKSPDCFDSPSWYEITIGGKKIVGSAQRRTPYGILQQGSILISIRRFREFHELFRSHPDKMGAGGPYAEGSNMTSLEELLRNECPVGRVKQALLQGFRDAYGIHFLETRISREGQHAAHDLVTARYGRSDWNLYRKFSQFGEKLKENHS